MTDGTVGWDESRLQRLAAAPPEDLFPVLHRDGAFLPLITLLAVLPALFALRVRPFDEPAAAWGIRAVEMASTNDPRVWIDPSRLPSSEGVRWASPLASWLTAAALQVPPAAKRGGLFVVSYLSTVGLLLALFAMWRRIAGHRFAFWVALAAAFHGPLLKLAQDPAPRALALFLAVASAGAYFRHALRRRDEFLSWALFAAGALLGLCVLAGGSLAVVLFAILALWTVWQSRGRRPGEPRRPGLDLPFALGGLLVLALIAFAVGGWWPAMMFSRHGGEFLSAWLWQLAPATAADASSTRFGLAGARLISINGLLIWLSLLGLLTMIRPATGRDEADARARRLLAAWLAVASLVWLPTVVFRVEERSPALWDALLLVPCLGLAAAGLEAIARGRIGLVGTATIAVGTVFVGLPLSGLPEWAQAAGSAAVWPVMAALAAALGILWWLREGFGERERLVRWAVAALALAPLGANAFMGLQTVDRRGDDERALSAVRDKFRAVPEASECIVIVADPRTIPPPLEYVLRSQWVRARFTIAPDWDAALDRALVAPRGDSPLVLVDWNPRGTRPGDFRVRGLDVRQLKSSPIYAGRVVQGYVATRRSRAPSS
ncbi:MAG: hypothetical protein WD066_09800 [Planctomycetaceae bacterium]